MSGLGEFNNTELEKALAGKQVSCSMSMNNEFNRVSGSSTVKDLETLFQLNYLMFTVIRKDEKKFNNLDEPARHDAQEQGPCSRDGIQRLT